MNWNAIIAAAEVVGVIAVIASLIYVAIQIRQNTSIARANIVHATSDSWMNFHGMLAGDDSLADIYRRGTLGKQLTETEVVRFEALITTYMIILEDLDHQYKSNLYFDEDDGVEIVEFMAPDFKPLLLSPIGREWWRRVAPHAFTPSVYEKISKIMVSWDEEVTQ